MLLDRYSADQLLVALLWIHAAFIIIPVIALVIHFEWREWFEKHPRLEPRRRHTFHWPFQPQHV
jgi:hypothetical protein